MMGKRRGDTQHRGTEKSQKDGKQTSGTMEMQRRRDLLIPEEQHKRPVGTVFI